MHNDGKEYEQFVADLQQAIIASENIIIQKNISVESNKKIKDIFGNEREFDLYWEYELGGLTYKTVIECKDYNSSVSVDKIDALIGKVRDFPDLKAVFATKKSYQKGAKEKAEQNKIDLLIIRKQNDSDWQDAGGNPYLKKILIDICMDIPAMITKFEPIVDGEWVKSNTKIDASKPLNIGGPDNEIFIEDLDNHNKYSLKDLASELVPLGNQEFGKFSKQENFKNAFLYFRDLKLKICSYRMEYSVSKPLNSSMEIDFSEKLVGVVEYLQKRTKKLIFRDGIVRDDDL